MTGLDHYREAERLLNEAAVDGPEGTHFVRPENLAAAQVHATLALTAVYALSQPVAGDTSDGSGHATVDNYKAWVKAAGQDAS